MAAIDLTARKARVFAVNGNGTIAETSFSDVSQLCDWEVLKALADATLKQCQAKRRSPVCKLAQITKDSTSNPENSCFECSECRSFTLEGSSLSPSPPPASHLVQVKLEEEPVISSQAWADEADDFKTELEAVDATLNGAADASYEDNLILDDEDEDDDPSYGLESDLLEEEEPLMIKKRSRGRPPAAVGKKTAVRGSVRGMLQCEKCKREYKSSASYAKHIKICAVGEPNNLNTKNSLRCKICLIQLGSETTLKSHIEIHRSKMDSLDSEIACPLCQRMLPTKFDLNPHIQSEHDPKKGCCVLCGCVTLDTFLEKHMKRKHFWKKHLCPTCGREFDMLTKLSIHLATAHGSNDAAKVVCDQCGKQFKHKERLRQHIGFFHRKDGKKPKCLFCSKVFGTWHALYKHKKTHSKTKPFQCRFCEYRAVFKSNVGIHLKKVHKHQEIARDDIIRVAEYEYDELPKELDQSQAALAGPVQKSLEAA